MCCCWYHKGTNFQANHNKIAVGTKDDLLLLIPQRYEFSSKSQRQHQTPYGCRGCCWYHKGTNFQANHNSNKSISMLSLVVADTTKVRIFKQITTGYVPTYSKYKLLLIPQRYEFSSKSQRVTTQYSTCYGCCWYHKGTNFQANHNRVDVSYYLDYVVADTTKVRIFKQITTLIYFGTSTTWLLLIPQRYEFSSKSQLLLHRCQQTWSCCWYHKGTNFQANHNQTRQFTTNAQVVADTTKVRIFKQITTS